MSAAIATTTQMWADEVKAQEKCRLAQRRARLRRERKEKFLLRFTNA